MKRLLVLSLVLVLCIACLPGRRGPARPRGSKEPPVTSVTKKSPERQASDSLILQGRRSLDQGLFDQASDIFQEAVNIDPTNGAGFYYLALVKYRTGEYGAVWDFLEKAESLLKDDEDWAERLESLRAEVTQAKP